MSLSAFTQDLTGYLAPLPLFIPLIRGQKIKLSRQAVSLDEAR